MCDRPNDNIIVAMLKNFFFNIHVFVRIYGIRVRRVSYLKKEFAARYYYILVSTFITSCKLSRFYVSYQPTVRAPERIFQ